MAQFRISMLICASRTSSDSLSFHISHFSPMISSDLLRFPSWFCDPLLQEVASALLRRAHFSILQRMPSLFLYLAWVVEAVRTLLLLQFVYLMWRFVRSHSVVFCTLWTSWTSRSLLALGDSAIEISRILSPCQYDAVTPFSRVWSTSGPTFAISTSRVPCWSRVRNRACASLFIRMGLMDAASSLTSI